MRKTETERRADLAAVWPPDAATAAEAGHEPMSPMQAIRRYCVVCCGGQPGEVRQCVAIDCPSWPFRSGQHPYTAKRLSRSENIASEGNSDKNGDPADDSTSNSQAEKGPQGADFRQSGASLDCLDKCPGPRCRTESVK